MAKILIVDDEVGIRELLSEILRDLGFTVEECRQLLNLYDDDHRESSEVKALASQTANKRL